MAKTILDTLKKTEDGKYILPLKNPVTIGTKKVDELHLEEPRAKHLRGLSSNPGMSEVLDVIAKLAGEMDAVIDELSMEDTNRASEYFGAFG